MKEKVLSDAKPRVAIFDLDGTITNKGTYIPFLLFVARRQPWRFIYAIPILLVAGLYKIRLLSRATLKEVMLKALLGSVSRETLRRYVEAFARRYLNDGVRPGAIRAMEKHRSAGDRLIMATASFAFYAEELAKRLGFDGIVATEVRWHDDELLCKINGANCRGLAKLKAIQASYPDLKHEYRIVAYSDHHVDLPLLLWADSGVAVNPSGRLRTEARTLDMTIVDWNVG
tara:strand:- start:532 stop:1218 length:687 start_codon:yes stop_codon:yes gene_type:complete